MATAVRDTLTVPPSVCEVVRTPCGRVHGRPQIRGWSPIGMGVGTATLRSMLLERLLDHLAVRVRPFARCDVASGCCLAIPELGWVTLHIVVAGEGELRTPAGRLPLRPGTLAVVPARLPHRLRRGDGAAVTSVDEPTTRTPGVLTHYLAAPDGETGADRSGRLEVVCGEVQALFSGSIGLFDLLNEPVVVDLSDSEPMRDTLQRLVVESQQTAPGQDAMLEALMHAALIQLFRRLCEQGDCELPWLAALEDPRLAPALDAMLSQPERDHSLESLAQVATMSRSSFADGFRAVFGQTPMAFLRDVRLRRAQDLLSGTDLAIETIAHRVGFASRSHFSRAFAAAVGASPSVFRQQEGRATT